MKLCPACGHAFDAAGWYCPACGHQPSKVAGLFALAPKLAVEGSGFQPEYFYELAELEAGNFWFQARNSLIIWTLQHFFPNLHRFLEIGCGTGFVLSGVATAFPLAEMTGSEIFSAGLSHAARRVPKVELLQMDARALPYKEHFDVIGAFDVLEHISEDKRVLAEIYRALNPGGGLLLTVPQHPWLWSSMDEYACHVRRYTVIELRRKVSAAGFSVVRMTSFISLLLPLMLTARLQKRKPTQGYDPLAELRMSTLSNRLLAMVLTAERYLIQSGINFPAGGSYY
ncbi:MAG: methyltransferase domain-containing protein [Candidatus Competibacteraceae bacterium]|nr:methyltransferase domain-containing protein [Candidatus Competibacteraceae bacterium]